METNEAQNTSNPMETTTPEQSQETAPMKPEKKIGWLKTAWTGLQFQLADGGISIVVGILFGLVLVFSDVLGQQVLALYVGASLGFIVSAYVAFVLYRSTSKEMSVLLALIAWGVVFNFIDSALLPGTMEVSIVATMFVIQIAAYFGGWYLAKKTHLTLPLLKGGWLMTAVVLGGILLLFTVLEALSVLVA